ncbi:hypothetical protein F4859DRAFT_49433 [Xylaria cf. heliscus]|nr:hypothetical protein F4859DRAFT_49433 [Xylaria cf. heliscus]
MARTLPSFHMPMRRATWGTYSDQSQPADEVTPLLGRAPRDDSREGRWIGIQWRIRDVAGMNSDNPMVRWPARLLYFVKVILMCAPINWLLVLAPLSILGDRLGWPPSVVLGLVAASILPMIAVLDFLTEELSQTMGETGGGLFSTFAGSVGGLAVRATLLGHGKVRLAQTSIIGQLLFTLLFIPGACFLISGLTALRQTNGTIQNFANNALVHTYLHLIIPSLVILIPSTLLQLLELKGSTAYEHNIQLMSCIAAIILAVFCCFWLLFELRTHIGLYSAEFDVSDENLQVDELDGPLLSRPVAGLSALAVTFIIVLCSGFMADVIQKAEDIHEIKPPLLGLVFIPIITSGAESLAAIIVAWKARLDLSVRTILASNVQFLLVSIPGNVFLGFALQGQPMTLYFTTSELVSGAVSIALIAYVLQRGGANYLDGVMLIGLYITIMSNFVISSVSV